MIPICLSCGCCRPADPHAGGHITLPDLERAAKAAGITVPQAMANMTLCLVGHDHSVAKELALETPYAACRVVKTAEEQRFTLGVAYPAMRADKSRAADGFRDFVSAEVLEKTAWNWLVNHREVNLFHKGKTEGHFTPTESYIWRFGDLKLPSPVDGQDYVVKQGSWMLGGLWDEYGWGLVKAGLVNGWSPEGGARRALPSAERLALVEV